MPEEVPTELVESEETKVSTKPRETNTVDSKQEYFLPKYMTTVLAKSPEEAVKLAEKQATQSN